MKLFTIQTLTLLLMPILAFSQDFYTAYKAQDSLPNLRRLVYNGVDRPFWKGDTLFYQTNTPNGVEYFSLIAPNNIIQLDKLPNEPQINRRGRNEGPFISPDNKYQAFIKDNNIWVKDISNGEVKQLSWDGAANASDQEIHWSPD